MFKKFKEKCSRFINNLAQSNKSNYGEGGINCCELKDVNETKNTNVK